jgi:hypothetical protein
LLVEIRIFDGDSPPDALAVSIDNLTEKLASSSESTDGFGCEKLDYAEMKLDRNRQERDDGHGRSNERDSNRTELATTHRPSSPNDFHRNSDFFEADYQEKIGKKKLK